MKDKRNCNIFQRTTAQPQCVETATAGVGAHRDWRVGAPRGGEGGTPPFASPSELQHSADGAE